MIFLEILGTVESSLCQLAALVRYSLPVRLTHHKTNSALSICILLLFKISPANLEEKSKGDVVLWLGRRILELTYFNNIDKGNSKILQSPRAWNSIWLFHVSTLTGNCTRHHLLATQSCFGFIKFVVRTAVPCWTVLHCSTSVNLLQLILRNAQPRLCIAARRIYPFLSRFGRACGVVVWELEVVIQAFHILTFPLPTSSQPIQLVYINRRSPFRLAQKLYSMLRCGFIIIKKGFIQASSKRFPGF